MIAVPDELRRALAYDHGQSRADAFVARAPLVAHDCARRLGLDLGEPLPGGRLSLCVACRSQTGDELVLKVPYAPASGRREIRALRAWADGPVPRVVAVDMASGAFAMTRVRPGGLATDGPPGSILVALHRPPPGRFPALARAVERRLRWAAQRATLDGNDVGLRLWEHAAPQAADLLATQTERVLLHGDLQPKNLLAGERGPVAIDPLPVLGERAYDAAIWSALALDASFAERADRLAAALALDPSRVLAWTRVLAALEYRPYWPEQAEAIRQFLRT